MSMYTPSEIYAAARALLPALKEDIRAQVKAWLKQAEQGGETHLLILEALSKDETTRRKMRELLQKPDLHTPKSRGFAGLPGAPQTTPGEVWVCPEPKCADAYVIGEAGEDAGKCSRHGLRRIRQTEKQGEGY